MWSQSYCFEETALLLLITEAGINLVLFVHPEDVYIIQIFSLFKNQNLRRIMDMVSGGQG